MKIGSISIKTASDIRKVAWTVKQAHEQFVLVYKQAFADCCGKDWESEWRTWDDFEEVVDTVEEQIKDVCVETGMPKSTWTKYRTGCRNVVFFDIPFKFRSISTTTIVEARKLADSYEDGSPEQRINRALKELREASGTKYAANAAQKGGMTVLRLPQEGEDACGYSHMVLERLASFLDNEKVRAVDQKQLDWLRQAIDTAMEPPKRTRKRKTA